MSNYKLFIDDERFPISDDYVIVRTSQEAIDYVKSHGIPSFISFDHDLGGNDTSMIFLHWFIEYVLDNKIDISNFTYYVHSMNPIGKRNIEYLLDCFLTYINNGE